MSNVKPNKSASAVTAKAGQSGKKGNAKERKLHWMKQNKHYANKKKKPPPKDPGKPNIPPKDAQEFSANWKQLLGLLKDNPPEKKEPMKHSPALKTVGPLTKPSKDTSKNHTTHTQSKTIKTEKNTSVPNKLVPKDSQVIVNGPAASNPPQSKAIKRKPEAGKTFSNHTTKKKKVAPEEKKPTEADLWFDDVDPDDVEEAFGAEAADIMRKKTGVHKKSSQDTESALVKERAFEGITRAVAMDCEMVGVGPDGEDSIVARVSLVNQFGKCIYDKYVKPTEEVIDYRTAVSGIRPEDIVHGEDVLTVQKEVADILKGRILVGHAVHNDIKILLLDHPKKNIRDTQKYKPFKREVKSSRPSLKLLSKKILNVDVQKGEHSSVQDAQATMRLYTMVKKRWEADIRDKYRKKDTYKERQKEVPVPGEQD